MKTIRWIGLRNCREKQKVPIIVATPRIERIEAQRSTMARVWSWSSESAIVKFVTSVEETQESSNELATGLAITYNLTTTEREDVVVYVLRLLLKQGGGQNYWTVAVCADNTYLVVDDVLPNFI